MPKLNQWGAAAQLLILLILLAGLGVGVYLVKTGNLKLFSSANNPPIVFKSLDGSPLPVNKNGIPQTISPNVRVEITSTLGPPASVSGPVSGPVRQGTVIYRTGFSPADLNSAAFRPYLKEPTIYNVGFKNTPGAQFYWVEFKAAGGRTDRRLAQIEIVSSCTPRPACLDAKSACKLAEPNGGWCPSPGSTPTPTPFVCTACAADINGNGRVDAPDYARLAICWGAKPTDIRFGISCAGADINGDGKIDQPDLYCLQSQYMQYCRSAPTPVPTPISTPI